MSEASDHLTQVEKWLAHAAKDQSPEQLLDLFEQALDVLWKRVLLTLGEVTLAAVMDRVLHNASERFLPFRSIVVDSSGANCRELRARARTLDPPALLEAIRFVVVEFLLIIGSLTGDLLTPALHQELSKIRSKDSVVRRRHEEGKS